MARSRRGALPFWWYLIVADAEKGLLSISQSGAIEVLAISVDGEKMKFVEIQDGPQILRKITRHFDNLYQVPLLFFILVGFTLITKVEVDLFIILSWIYFSLRVVHSIVHLITH